MERKRSASPDGRVTKVRRVLPEFPRPTYGDVIFLLHAMHGQRVAARDADHTNFPFQSDSLPFVLPKSRSSSQEDSYVYRAYREAFNVLSTTTTRESYLRSFAEAKAAAALTGDDSDDWLERPASVFLGDLVEFWEEFREHMCPEFMDFALKFRATGALRDEAVPDQPLGS